MKKEIIVKHLGYAGRMLGGSKSMYRIKNPNNQVYFNAQIFVDGEWCWGGDIDLTLDKEKINNIANELSGQTIEVRPESENYSVYKIKI